MTLFEKINTELTAAMKNKDEKRLSVMRMVKSKLLLENARGEIPDDQAQKIIGTYAKQLKDAIKIAQENDKTEAARETIAELAIVQEFLPAEMSEDDIKKIITKVLAETGAADMSAMGKVMGLVMKDAKGADGNLVRELVTAALQKSQ